MCGGDSKKTGFSGSEGQGRAIKSGPRQPENPKPRTKLLPRTSNGHRKGEKVVSHRTEERAAIGRAVEKTAQSSKKAEKIVRGGKAGYCLVREVGWRKRTRIKSGKGK